MDFLYFGWIVLVLECLCYLSYSSYPCMHYDSIYYGSINLVVVLNSQWHRMRRMDLDDASNGP